MGVNNLQHRLPAGIEGYLMSGLLVECSYDQAIRSFPAARTTAMQIAGGCRAAAENRVHYENCYIHTKMIEFKRSFIPGTINIIAFLY
jgi:hypothetical protein